MLNQNERIGEIGKAAIEIENYPLKFRCIHLWRIILSKGICESNSSGNNTHKDTPTHTITYTDTQTHTQNEPHQGEFRAHKTFVDKKQQS